MKENSMHIAARPWYREPWPWILAAGPFIVVIAAFYTAWLAVKSNDGLVTDDYYRKGLSANQTIARSEQAIRLGLVAGVRIAEGTLSVRLRASDNRFVMPPTLMVTVSHPTRAGLDQSRLLVRSGELYSGEIRLPAAGHWLYCSKRGRDLAFDGNDSACEWRDSARQSGDVGSAPPQQTSEIELINQKEATSWKLGNC
jgi:hypothetical protein